KRECRRVDGVGPKGVRVKVATPSRIASSGPGMRLRAALRQGLLFNFEQFGHCQPECPSHCLEHPKANLFLPKLQIRDVVFMHSGFFGKIDLPPVTLQAQLPNSLSKSNADVSCHPYYRRDNLEAASTLSYGYIGESVCRFYTQ